MSKLLLGTDTVDMDEPAFILKELIGPALDSRGCRRYQIIKVIRHDSVAEYRRDLGPAESFSAGEFQVPGGVADPRTGRIYIEHTVGELIDIADLLREGPYDHPDPPQPNDLIQGYFDSFDLASRQRKAQTTFGHGGWVQRT